MSVILSKITCCIFCLHAPCCLSTGKLDLPIGRTTMSKEAIERSQDMYLSVKLVVKSIKHELECKINFICKMHLHLQNTPLFVQTYWFS